MTDPVTLPVTEASQTGEARRLAAGLAEALGLGEAERGKVALVVTEAATNLVRHARGGEMIFSGIRESSRTGLEVLALDRGPGIANPAESLQDGYSTQGTSGQGLGAIGRLSDSFDLHSLPGVGTALLARIWSAHEGQARRQDEVELGAVRLPMPGEQACGDAWSAVRRDGRCLVAVVDGLGHGLAAADAAREAVRIFQANAERSPGEILEAAHAGLRGTRGAAMAVAELRAGRNEVCFAGIGNVAGSVVSPEGISHLVSHNGTIGHQVRKVQEFVYPWPEGGLVIFHSDGLATQWRLATGLAARDPSLIAGVLYRDFKRGRDDVTVLVARRAPAGAGRTV